MMKKYFPTLFLTALMLPLSSVAEDIYRVQKLELVKSIYNMSDLGFGRAMTKKLTKDFHSAWLDYVKSVDGVPCIGADPVIDGQDHDEELVKKTIKVRYLPNGKVEATFRQFNFDKKFTAVRYAIKCSGNKCLIDDIFNKVDNNQWFSFKKDLRQCVADHIAERKQEQQEKLKAMQSKNSGKQYSTRKPAYTGSSCSCASGNPCFGPRGGRFCITSGGNKRYY